MTSFFSVINRIRSYKVPALLNIGLNLLAVIFSLVSLVMVIPFLNILFDRQELVENPPLFSFSTEWLTGSFNYYLSQIIVYQGKEQALLSVCFLVVLVFLLKNLFRYGALYFMAIIRNGVVRDIRQELYEKVLTLPIGYFTEERRGDITARITADVQLIEWSIMSFLEVTFREPVTILLFLVSMLIISPTLTLFVLIILPITGFIIGRVGKTLKKKSHNAQQRLGVLMTLVEESLSGLRILQAYNAVPQQNAKFRAANNDLYRISKSMLRRGDLSSPLSEFLSITIVALVLYVGGKMVLHQSIGLSAESFIAFMLIFSQILPPAKAISTAYYNIQRGMASVERINQIMDAPVLIKDRPNAQAIPSFEQSIELQNVGFAYQNKQIILENITQSIQKGQIIALVGASGAGKSTLADLIPRFYDVTAGAILMDGINIQDYRLEDVRGLIGIVTQRPVLFNDTIWNNITLGMEGISEAEVIQAAKVANAYDFIRKLADGFSSNVGDGGCKLSGGEQQRLTIARAVLKNPPILILDEATSSLDAASEQLVQEALQRVMQRRTAIVIAHRLSTIRFADEIWVMQAGKIVEQGSHQDLLKQHGVYRKLVELQEI